MNHFNSHTREGVTLLFIHAQEAPNFNSHTREGVTEIAGHNFSDIDFNSHTREGVTAIFLISSIKFTFQLTHP